MSDQNLTKITRMLIAIDKSGYKDRIASYALSLAKLTGAEIRAIHVIDKSSLGVVGEMLGYYRGGKVEAYVEVLKKQSEKLLDEIRTAGEDQGVTVKAEVIVGSSAAESIIDYAKDNGIDLIVIGTKGMSGVQKFLLGSVANNVIVNAHCPVLAIR